MSNAMSQKRPEDNVVNSLHIPLKSTSYQMYEYIARKDASEGDSLAPITIVHEVAMSSKRIRSTEEKFNFVISKTKSYRYREIVFQRCHRRDKNYNF